MVLSQDELQLGVKLIQDLSAVYRNLPQPDTQPPAALLDASQPASDRMQHQG